MSQENHLQPLSGNKMRFEESLKIHSIIKKHNPIKNIINLGSGNVEQTLYALLGSTAQVIVFPAGTTVGTANPKYTFNVLVTEWMPLDAQVGELTTASITWPIDGTVAKATA